MFFWPLHCLALSRCLCLSCKRHVEVKIGLLFPAFPFITALEHSVSAFQSHAPLHCLSLGRSQAVCSASLRAHSTHNVPHFGGIRCKWHLWDAVRGQTVCLLSRAPKINMMVREETVRDIWQRGHLLTWKMRRNPDWKNRAWWLFFYYFSKKIQHNIWFQTGLVMNTKVGLFFSRKTMTMWCAYEDMDWK